MKMNLEDLLDYMDEPDIEITPPAGVSEERIRNRVMEQIKPLNHKKRRMPRIMLIAIAVAFILCITVCAAYYWVHTREQDLLEKAPIDGGWRSTVEINDQSKQVIEDDITDYQMEQVSDEASVVLNSVMGFHSEDYSVAYVTVTVTPTQSDNTELDSEYCCFDHVKLQPQNRSIHLSGDAALSSVRNEDGSVSIMIAFQFRYQDVTDIPLLLELENFFCDDYHLNGEWRFEIDKLQLIELSSVDPHNELFAGSTILPLELQLSDFGGEITLRGYYALLDKSFRESSKERFGNLPLDWNNLQRDYSQIRQLNADGIITDQQAEDLWKMAESFDSALRIGIEYADGTQYWGTKILDAIPLLQIAAHRGLLTDEEMKKIAGETGYDYIAEVDEEMVAFLFLAPQDMSAADYLILGDVKIPLRDRK